MKTCEICGEEIGTPDGEGRCSACEDIAEDAAKNKASLAKRRAARRAREQAMRDCGLTKVRGALGGTYWE